MCTVLLPPGDNPIAINKYIILIAFPLLTMVKRTRLYITTYGVAYLTLYIVDFSLPG